jgi:metacaspase-1
MDYAVLVGINAYPDPNRLNGCVNDVTDICDSLINYYNFRQPNISILLDQQANAENIKQDLKSAVQAMTAGDRLVFWYSGHGAQLVDGDASTDVICPIDFDFTTDHSVTVDDFHSIFSSLSIGSAVYWGSDSCHSGDLDRSFRKLGIPRLFKHSGTYRDILTKKISFRRTLSGVARSIPNVAFVSGCESNQTSADAYIDGRYNGAFTYYFLQFLKSDKDDRIPLAPAVRSIDTALNGAGYDQEPQLTGPSSLTTRPWLDVSAQEPKGGSVMSSLRVFLAQNPELRRAAQKAAIAAAYNTITSSGYTITAADIAEAQADLASFGLPIGQPAAVPSSPPAPVARDAAGDVAIGVVIGAATGL